MAIEPVVTTRRHKSIDCPISRSKVFDCFHDGTRVVAEVRCNKCPESQRIPASAAWNVASVADRLRACDWAVDSEGRSALCPTCKKPKRERGEIPIGKPSAPPPPANPPRRSDPLTVKPLAKLDEIVASQNLAAKAIASEPPPAQQDAPAIYATERASKMAPHLAPRLCARPACGVMFKPDRVTHIYHTPDCGSTHKLERRRQTTMPSTMTTSTAHANTPEAIRAERLMYQLIDDHYDGETHLFDEGWNDERIAKESSVALARVRACREALYGKPVSVELLKLQHEIGVAIEQSKKDRATLEAMARDTIADLRALVKEALDRNHETLKELAGRVAREIGSDS